MQAPGQSQLEVIGILWTKIADRMNNWSPAATRRMMDADLWSSGYCILYKIFQFSHLCET